MVLTAEQRKRMEDNRKRAQELKKQNQIKKDESAAATTRAASRRASSGACEFEAGGFVGAGFVEAAAMPHKKRRPEVDARPKDTVAKRKSRGDRKVDQDAIDGDDESSLEDFEHNASTHISQAEAKRSYCVPPGTLAVCAYIERENPHQRGWAKMKLYSRSDVRRRARKRFGGKGGLVEEREKRKKKRFEKDMEEMKDVFS